MTGQEKPQVPPEVCPVCGEDVPRNAVACPGCGSDHTTGWNDDNRIYDGLDLPDNDFNYNEFIKKEFGPPSERRGVKSFWWIAAIIILIAFIVLSVFSS